MTCDACQSQIDLYVAGVLEPADAEAVRAHLASGCPQCQAALVEAQEAFALIGLTAHPVIAPASARAKLNARIDASEKPVAGRISWVSLLTSGLAAALAFAVSTLVYNHKVRELDRTTAALREKLNQQDLQLARATVEKSGLSRENAQLASQVAALHSQNVSLVSLATENSKAHGRILWDKDRNEWHVYVFNLQPQPKDKTYELWFITKDGRKIASNTFNVDEKGAGSVTNVKIPVNISELHLAAITDEPAGGVQVPTGSIHLAGQVQ